MDPNQNPAAAPQPINAAPVTPEPGTNQPGQAQAPSAEKDYLTAWLLSYFLGIFGVDRFYLGYTGLGVVKLLTLGGCGLWALVDWVLIFAGVLKDSNGQPLKDREKNFKLTVILFVVFAVLGIAGNIISVLIR
jgi:hypothetical protein